jgi:hypothetical protein
LQLEVVIETQEQASQVMTYLLGAIASVSLLVVLRQFLVEAIDPIEGLRYE